MSGTGYMAAGPSKPAPALVWCRDRQCQAVGCQHRKPHKPHELCAVASSCYDRRPYVDGGVLVWCEAVTQDPED